MRGGAWWRDRRLWIVLAVAALLAGLRLSGLSHLLSAETLRRHRAALTAWVDGHAVAAAAAYVAVYAAATAASLPGALFLTLAGGFLFGAVLGTALTVAGATAGAVLVFVFARAIVGPDALDRLGPRAAALAAGLRRNAASYLLVLRLVPLFPFFLVNLVPALVGIGLPVYAVTTAIGILPGTYVFSLSGAGLGGVLDAGGTLDMRHILTPQILGALAGLALLSLAAIPLRAWIERRR